MAAIGWKYYIFWTCWIAVQVAIVFFFVPETHGLALEEIAQVFGDALVDTEEAVNKVAGHQENSGKAEKSITTEHVEASK